jgi:hypothetical protein
MRTLQKELTTMNKNMMVEITKREPLRVQRITKILCIPSLTTQHGFANGISLARS